MITRVAYYWEGNEPLPARRERVVEIHNLLIFVVEDGDDLADAYHKVSEGGFTQADYERCLAYFKNLIGRVKAKAATVSGEDRSRLESIAHTGHRMVVEFALRMSGVMATSWLHQDL